MAPALGFVTEEGGRNAKNYKYAGQDLSLIYKYFASPFAAFLVTLLPRWLAYVHLCVWLWLLIC